MSRMKQLYELTSSLRGFARAAECVAENIECVVTLLEDGEPAPTAVTLDRLRNVLSDKGMAGHNEQVRALLVKYGAKRLSDVDPTLYPTLLADAEAL